jgi:hypothetical protein
VARGDLRIDARELVEGGGDAEVGEVRIQGSSAAAKGGAPQARLAVVMARGSATPATSRWPWRRLPASRRPRRLQSAGKTRPPSCPHTTACSIPSPRRGATAVAPRNPSPAARSRSRKAASTADRGLPANSVGSCAAAWGLVGSEERRAKQAAGGITHSRASAGGGRRRAGESFVFCFGKSIG